MEELIICENCIEIFNSKEELLEHKCNINNNNNIKKVIIINNESNNDLTVKKTMKIEENKKIVLHEKKKKMYRCEQCKEFETEYKNNYYRHKKKYCKMSNINK